MKPIDPSYWNVVLVVALALLSAIALVGALLTESTDAYNLAAVGLGAMAGALTTVFRSKD